MAILSEEKIPRLGNASLKISEHAFLYKIIFSREIIFQSRRAETSSYSLYCAVHYREARRKRTALHVLNSSTAHTATYYACMYIYTHGTIHCGGIDNLEKATLGALLLLL